MYAECLMQCSEVVGYKLRSSIRDDFLGHALVIVDLTYECFDDVALVELLLRGTILMNDENRSMTTKAYS